ncbi:hypothetical protein TUBRATIS_003610 [Tubulinosema ratisbonensis]|uniref:Uncharacterized protein n=1 Tax=Tubulinosema ratisbonensis TaxID=291195 RepID=A0A437APD6_9MICR|nr:hypothetical protein TUBRATIS_003610 [Tubulinosema ratisbonensis]
MIKIYFYLLTTYSESITKSSFSKASVMSDSKGDMRKEDLNSESSKLKEKTQEPTSKSLFGSLEKSGSEHKMNNDEFSKDTSNVGAKIAEETLEREINAELKAVRHSKSEKNHNLSTNNALVALGDESTKTSANINKIIQGLGSVDDVSGNLFSFLNKDSAKTQDSKVSSAFGISGGKDYRDLESTRKFDGLDSNSTINGRSGGGGVLRGGGFSGMDLVNSAKEGGVSINGTSYLENQNLQSQSGGAFETSDRITKDGIAKEALQLKQMNESQHKEAQEGLYKKVVEKEAERKIDQNKRSFSEFTGDNKQMEGGKGFQAISGQGYAGSKMNSIDKENGYSSFMKTSNHDINEMIKNMHKIHNGNDNTNYLAGKAVLAGESIYDTKDTSAKIALDKIAASAGFVNWQEYQNEERSKKLESNKKFFGQQFFAGNYADFTSAAGKRHNGKKFYDKINGFFNKYYYPYSNNFYFFDDQSDYYGKYYDSLFEYQGNINPKVFSTM